MSKRSNQKDKSIYCVYAAVTFQLFLCFVEKFVTIYYFI